MNLPRILVGLVLSVFVMFVLDATAIQAFIVYLITQNQRWDD